MDPWIVVVVSKKDGKIKLYRDGDIWRSAADHGPEWAEPYPRDEAEAVAAFARKRTPALADEIEVIRVPTKQDWTPRGPVMGAARRRKPQEKTSWSFSELSPEAKKRAIEDYRQENEENLFDQDDAHHLTELFETDLQDHYGLGPMKANWSLGYCQGDGVCFHGHVDLETFLKAERKKKRFGDLIGRASATITNEDSRYCHWNSMAVEVVSDVDADAFLPKRLLDRYQEWVYESRHRVQVRHRVAYDRAAPLRAWQREVDRWREEMEQKHYRKQDWSPRVPSPPEKPQELDLEMPELLEMPADIKAAFAQAEQDFAQFNKDLDAFQEYLTERVQEISRELEKMGYDEIEYHSSDAYIGERLEVDDEEYRENGSLLSSEEED